MDRARAGGVIDRDAYTGPERRSERRRGPLRVVLDALYAEIRWIADHVRGFYAAVGVFLALGLALSALALGVFAFLARSVAGGLTQALDEAVLRWAARLGNPALDALALAGAGLGSSAAVWVVLGLGTAVLWLTRHRYSMLLLWAALVGGYVLNRLLKATFDRPRPAGGDLHLLGWSFDFPASPSFPSGHALMSVVVFGTLAYLVARLEPTPRMRRLTLGAAAVLILLIGLSRIYLGVHYPSDVLAGYLAGFVWATTCALGIEAIRYFRTRRPEVAEAELDLDKGIRPLRDAVRDGRDA